MIIKKEDLKINARTNAEGKDKLLLSNLMDFEGFNPKVKMFSHAKLLPGEEVAYHMHEGEAESYYILSGKGIYNDNGEEYEASAGMATFTPSGNGHGLKNTGEDMLEFIALIILD